MRKNTRLAVFGSALALAAAGATLQAPAAEAGDRICRGSIGAKTIDDNIRVPAGATCRLTRTNVKGNVIVKRNARLFANRVRVDGNVQGENAKNVVVQRSSRIEGDVQVKQGRKATVRYSFVDGNIQYDKNRGYLRANFNRVNGDIQVFGNRGGAVIRKNRVDGNLQCKGNRPRPTGGGNVVSGNKEDQCRRF